MDIVVVGGTGRIGSRLVNRLRNSGHRVTAASRSTGVDTISREGLSEALAGAEVVVDVTNAPSTEASAATWFFVTSTAHLLTAEKEAGVRYHVGLSILGADRVSSGYFRAKLAQEQRVQQSGIPYAILRSTSFFEDIAAMATAYPDEPAVRLPGVPVQPVSADDVSAVLAHLALGPAVNGRVEMAGPEEFSLDQLAKRILWAAYDPREVVADPYAPYLGAVLDHRDRSLLPDLRVATTRLDDWLYDHLPLVT